MTRALALLALLVLAACGFQLRGTAKLPFETLYVPNATSGIALEVKRHVQSGSDTRVVDEAKGAQAQLQFLEESRSKEILSLNSAGRVREYRLLYRVSFRVADGRGGDYVPRSTVTLTRDITYDDTVALAKETEEQLLFREMQSDMVRQILRRIAALETAPAAN
ncbi:MAG: LPS assembly lipoprotein LptE [Betaproteobacteria bacterium]|nr:LPS assembly lipoprotein LptE [Betaproteobacteria bacterium]MDH5220621.1 LPS assembly lipoprotein LptE [Betaproteobacteria bacterium]MDH5350539.1 LPS assembly lipoprotein LptE [Betaproteobacteria bacterium]